jgi:hypothetical protein
MNWTSGWLVGTLDGVLLGVSALCVRSDMNSDRLVMVPEAEIGPPASLGVHIRRQLQRHSSDLQLPHDMDFYFYFPTELAARSPACDLRTEGFTISVSKSAAGDQWLCLATQRLVPDRHRLDGWGQWFERVAAAHGGEYDGWEGSIEQ